MEDILNATLAGGVAIGSPCGILYLPGVALAIGCIAGAISVVGFKIIGPKLVDKIGLYDTCGVHNLHGIPGLLGGISSAIIAACYNLGYDLDVAAKFGSDNIFATVNGSYLKQGGLQIAGLFSSVAVGIAFGIISGFIILTYYSE
jgi:ammonium transporter Rh